MQPQRYQVELAVDPKADAFQAKIEIDLELAAPAEVVWLNATGLTVSRAQFRTGSQAVEARAVPGGADFLGFVPARPLAMGPWTLSIEYRGEISKTSSNGLFRQEEGGDWYAFTHLEPIDARRVFPCFDEPSFKVPWQLRLRVPKELAALSNTPELWTYEGDGATKVVEFAPTRPLPSYLVAFAVGPFDLADAGRIGRKGAPVRIVTPKGRAAEARWAQASSAKILEQLEGYFGRPYPYEKVDLISVPVGTGAMENPGLVTFLQSLILARPEDESVQFKRAWGSVAMHELAHQWFGDLVTTAWWDDIWLNEAFATWMTNVLVPRWQAGWRWEENAAQSMEWAMRQDSLVSARCIRQPITSNDDVKNAFDAITYQKGAAVIAMFERWVGPERFRDGIRDYLAAHADGTATAEHFVSAIAARAPELPVKQAFATFLDRAGVPLVDVELACEKGAPPKLRLSQQRYLPVGSAGATAQLWQIPFCATYAAGDEQARSCTLLASASGELTLDKAKGCPTWVNANPELAGYYRVRYQKDLLPRLLAKGAAPLKATEKIGLLGDVRALVHSAQMPYADALALLPPLAGDGSRAVVAATISLAEALREDELFPDSLRPRYASFVRAVWGGRAHELGLATRESDDEDTRLLRPRVVSLVADEGEDSALGQPATAKAKAWLLDRGALDADMVGTVLTMAARSGDKALYEAYLAEARKPTTDRLNRERLLRAMGEFRRPELVSRSLELLLTDAFDFREGSALLWNALATPVPRALAYEFVKKHFDELVARAPRDWAAWLPTVSGAFCDERHRADAERFFTERAARFTGGPRHLQQALEEVRLCSAFKKAQEASVAAFLARQH